MRTTSQTDEQDQFVDLHRKLSADDLKLVINSYFNEYCQDEDNIIALKKVNLLSELLEEAFGELPEKVCN
jgi:hypothetical protein